jgi:hypothetical protein
MLEDEAVHQTDSEGRRQTDSGVSNLLIEIISKVQANPMYYQIPNRIALDPHLPIHQEIDILYINLVSIRVINTGINRITHIHILATHLTIVRETIVDLTQEITRVVTQEIPITNRTIVVSIVDTTVDTIAAANVINMVHPTIEILDSQLVTKPALDPELVHQMEWCEYPNFVQKHLNGLHENWQAENLIPT